MTSDLTIRITIMLNKELAKKLRLSQARLIQKTKKNVTFSKVLNDVVSKGLKNSWAKHDG